MASSISTLAPMPKKAGRCSGMMIGFGLIRAFSPKPLSAPAKRLSAEGRKSAALAPRARAIVTAFVNSTLVNDEIKKVTIIRNGSEAKKFTATQADFNRLKKEAGEKVFKEIEAKFPGAKKDANGIYYLVKKDGSGNKAGKGRQAAVHYTQ